jgi:hypothetical protein
MRREDKRGHQALPHELGSLRHTCNATQGYVVTPTTQIIALCQPEALGTFLVMPLVLSGGVREPLPIEAQVGILRTALQVKTQARRSSAHWPLVQLRAHLRMYLLKHIVHLMLFPPPPPPFPYYPDKSRPSPRTKWTRAHLRMYLLKHIVHLMLFPLPRARFRVSLTREHVCRDATVRARTGTFVRSGQCPHVTPLTDIVQHGRYQRLPPPHRVQRARQAPRRK